MSQTLEPIMFCDDCLTILPHSATDPAHVGAPVSLREFSRGERVRMMRDTATREFIFETAGRSRFVIGPWTEPQQ